MVLYQWIINPDLVEHALEIIQGIEDLHIQEDQNAVFMCELSLEDVPGDWYKDEHKLKPTSTIKIRREGQWPSQLILIYWQPTISIQISPILACKTVI